MKAELLAALRRCQTILAVAGKKRYLSHGKDLHIGRGTRLWAPVQIKIGDHVYIGKHVHIEANAVIGNFCLIANRVAFVGRHDHDYKRLGFPVRYSPWIGSRRFQNSHLAEMVEVQDDCWVGYGAIVLTGVTIGRGSIVAAGSVVVRDVPSYSVVAGVPARVVGQRFSTVSERNQHEQQIRDGRFAFSEVSYDSCVIEPGNIDA
ncbi:acyltransferase [Roseateles sp. P5_E7]